MEEPDPGAAMLVGLKLAVTPVGRPDALSAIAESKPPATVVLTLLVPEEPCAMVTDAGEAEIVKLGVLPELTVSEILAVWVTPPPVPVTVIV